MSRGTEVHPEVVRHWQRRSLWIGIPPLLLCVVAAWWFPATFFRAYLTTYQFFLGITLGCMVVLMIYHLTGGAWGYLSRRILESTASLMPLMAVLFTPIACGLGSLYVWARPGVLENLKPLRHLTIYLNAPFFWGRVAIYFAIWTTLALLLRRWSRWAEATGDDRYMHRMYLLSGPGLVIYGITITFAAIDWEMSLQPAFRSSLFGAEFGLGQIVSGLSFAVLIVCLLIPRTELGSLATPQVLNDLGNLLFAFLLLWCYAYYFQFMLIWIADLPNEVSWYLVKARDGWQWVGLTLFLLLFVTPFFLLLNRPIKRSPRNLGLVAGLICFMRLVCVYYDIMPNYPGTGIAEHWMDFFMPFALGGIWFAAFLWQLTRQPLLLQHDESRLAAMRLKAMHLQETLRKSLHDEVMHHA